MHYTSPHFPPDVIKLAKIFKSHGFELFAVGGAIRDSLLESVSRSKPHAETDTMIYDDIDFATDAKPEEIMSIFPKCIPTGIQHGTVTVIFRNVSYEVTTYRIDKEYNDFRRPDEVEFTRSLEKDISRRDFTINAMASDPLDGTIIDIFDGLTHLKEKKIVCVGVPTQRFNEDALRMLRAVRFSTKLGFELDAECTKGIQELSQNITHIAKERILTELRKMLCAPHPYKGILLLKQTNLMPYVLPNLSSHLSENHIQLAALALCATSITTVRVQETPTELESSEETIRIALLYSQIDDANATMKRSQTLSNTLSKELTSLKSSLRLINATRRLVERQHYLTIDDAKKKINSRINTFKLSLLVSQMSKNDNRDESVLEASLILRYLLRLLPYYTQRGFSTSDAQEEIETHLSLLSDDTFLSRPLIKKDLAVNGTMLREAFSRPAGKWIGNTIATMHRHVLAHPEENNKSTLMNLATRLLSSSSSVL